MAHHRPKPYETDIFTPSSRSQKDILSCQQGLAQIHMAAKHGGQGVPVWEEP